MLSGYDEDELKEVLLKDIETEVYELRKGAALLDKIGDFAPAWGMIGTLIGLIIMLQNLQDTSQIGTGMAVAMLTTLYGSVLANMIAIPLAEKIYRGIEDLYTEKKFVIEAISELYRGQIPSKLKLKLDTYVYETKVKKVKGAT